MSFFLGSWSMNRSATNKSRETRSDSLCVMVNVKVFVNATDEDADDRVVNELNPTPASRNFRNT